MLTIKVNGIEKKLNIGCRTFISLQELLKLLTANVAAVTLNDERIHRKAFAGKAVNNGDALLLATLDPSS